MGIVLSTVSEGWGSLSLINWIEPYLCEMLMGIGL